MRKTSAGNLTATVAVLSLLAACGSSSTTNEGTTPGVAPDSTLPDTTVPDTTVPDTTVPDGSSTGAPTTDPAAEPEPTPDTTAAPSTEPPPPATDAPPAPTVAPPSLVPTSDIAVVFGGGGGPIPWAPLAWWDGSAWNTAGYTADGRFVTPPPSPISNVSVTSLDLPDGSGQVIDGLTLGADDFYCVDDEMGPLIEGVEVAKTPMSLGYDLLAVTADWPLQPRAVSQVGADNPEYAAVGAALSSAPTADLGTVAQAVRVDLDGDGLEEVLVTYQYLTDSNFGAENDFSLVYVRYPNADGSVRDEVLVEYVLDAPDEFPTIGRYSIAAVADLNGDGVMEIATRSSFWESAGITAWALDDGSLTVIGSGGCGV